MTVIGVMYMLIVIAAVLFLGAGVFYAAMVVSSEQADTWQDAMGRNEDANGG